jgi:hypothetical protein
MQLRTARGRGLSMELKTLVLRLFQMVQAMAAEMVPFSGERKPEAQSSSSVRGRRRVPAEKESHTSCALRHPTSKWFVSSISEQHGQVAEEEIRCRNRLSFVGKRCFRASQRNTLHLSGAMHVQTCKTCTSCCRCLKCRL